MPEPGVDDKKLSYTMTQGRCDVEMQQADWHISIKRYMNVDGVDLPAKIFMQNDQFKVKLIIQTWDTNSMSSSSMVSRHWPAPAKLNLILHITGQRDDGYHLLQTVFQFIDICNDSLDFNIQR